MLLEPFTTVERSFLGYYGSEDLASFAASTHLDKSLGNFHCSRNHENLVHCFLQKGLTQIPSVLHLKLANQVRTLQFRTQVWTSWAFSCLLVSFEVGPHGLCRMGFGQILLSLSALSRLKN